MHMFLVVFLFATWSSIFSLAKMTLEHCPPILLTAARMLISSLIILGFLFIRKRKLLKLSKDQIIPISLLAILSIYLTNIFEFWGLQHLSAAKTCFIYSLSPFFAALFSYIHFKEKMNKRKWIGMIIGFLGITPVFLTQSKGESLLGGFSIFSWAELAIIGAALFSVYGWVLLRILVKSKEVSPLTANGWSMLIGGGLALIHSFFIDSWKPFPVGPSDMSGFIQGTLIMTFISNIFCYNLYGFLLKKFTATLMSFMGLLSPFFASLSEWIFLGQKPSLVILGSSCIVILGLWIIYKEELRQGYIIKKSQTTSIAES